MFSHGTPEEWEFGMQRLVNFPSNRSISERIFLLKSLAGCSRDPDQYERSVLSCTFSKYCNYYTKNIDSKSIKIKFKIPGDKE